MILILLLNGVVTTDLVFVVFDDNVLMRVEDMFAVFTIFVRLQLTNESYNSDERGVLTLSKAKTETRLILDIKSKNTEARTPQRQII